MQDETGRAKDRVLALEIRPRWTGFAMITGARLVDWGRRKYRFKLDLLPKIARKRVVELLDLHNPSFVLARIRKVNSINARRKIALVVKIVRREARKRSIVFEAISSENTKEFFASRQCKSKYQRAVLIARWFPDLSWKLPPKRKMWKSEHQRMVVFDAVATALTFLNRSPPGDQ